MTGRDPVERVEHVKNAIVTLRRIVGSRSLDETRLDEVLWPALERYFQIISEASRHIPQAWKSQYGPSIAWRRIADLGNPLRHAYASVQANVLWDILKNDLAPLEAAVDAMLSAHSPGSSS